MIAISKLLVTAANIIAAAPSPYVGQSFEFNIKNMDASGTGYNISLSKNSGHGSGITVGHVENITIQDNKTGRFMAVFTDVTSGSEALTIYYLTDGI